MQIRPASAAEAADCSAIYNYWAQCSTATFDHQGRDEAATKMWYTAHNCERFPLLAAVDDDGRVAGWGTLTPWSDRPGYRYTAEISIFVSPDYLRQGLGLKLGEALLDTARRTDTRIVLARLEASNQQSIALFERLGFSTAGIMHAVGHKFDRWLDVRLMQIDLQR